MGAGREILELGTKFGKRLLDELSSEEKKILKEISKKAQKENDQAAKLRQQKNKAVTSRTPPSGETTAYTRGDTDVLPDVENTLKKQDLKDTLVKNMQNQAGPRSKYGEFDNQITADKQKKLETEAYKGAAGQKLTTPKDGFTMNSSGSTPNVPAVVSTPNIKKRVLTENEQDTELYKKLVKAEEDKNIKALQSELEADGILKPNQSIKDGIKEARTQLSTATGPERNTLISKLNRLNKKQKAALAAAGLAVSTTIGEDDFREDPIVEPEKEEEAIPAVGRVVGPVDRTRTETTTTEKKVTYPKINLGESEEAKALAEQIKTSQATLGALKDPPITPQEMRQAAYDGLEKARKSRANLLQWGEVFENLVGAIAKYGAAREGLNRGLDMSNAEIRRTDWNSKIKQAFAEYESDLDNLTSQYDKENQAKDKVDSKRLALDTKLGDLRSAIGRARDIRAREQARLDAKRQEMLAQAKQRQEDRVSKENIAKAKAVGSGLKGKELSTFDKQKQNAQDYIDYLVNSGASRKVVKGTLEKYAKFLDEPYLSTLEEQGYGFGNDFKKVNPEEAPKSAEKESTQYSIQRGDVSDGYVFLGGNPNDPNNWKELK